MIDATLITIHGFWSSPSTWERLNQVWRADEELRGLRIRPFGYSSPRKPWLPLSVTRVPDYDDIAQTLATEYMTVLARASNIAVVTHSQGGLILQRFLAWMVSEGRARELSRIRSVVMLACPNGGSEYLESLRHALGYRRHPQAGSLQVLDRKVADTQRTVLQRIVNATVLGDHQCRIPFHVYAGGSDEIVKAASAQAAFPGALTIAGNHFSILDPATPGNHTAEIVKHHMLIDITAPRVQLGAGTAPELDCKQESPSQDAIEKVLNSKSTSSTGARDSGGVYSPALGGAMVWDTRITPVVHVLSPVISNLSVIRSIAMMAGLSMNFVSDAPDADSYWTAVLHRAQEEGDQRVDAVLNEVLARTPNPKVHNAIAAYWKARVR